MKYVVHGLLVITLLCVSNSAFAQAQPSRAQVFAELWSQILRPVESTRETPFVDVPETHEHFALLRYAKRRGILDDTENFYPSEPATWADVYLWLMRTRNSYDVDELYRELLGERIANEPLFQAKDPSTTVATLQEVVDLATTYDAQLDAEQHEASLYAEKWHGDGTAFGETFDMHALTAAHPRFPHNTLVKVTNVNNGKSVTVRINDRGPFVPGRSIDLSLAGFLAIEERSRGVATVTIERLGDVHLLDTVTVEPTVAEPETPEIPENIPEVGSCPILTERYRQRLTPGVYFVRGVPHMLAKGRSLRLQANNFFSISAVSHEGNGVDVVQQFITPNEESFRFTPEYEGEYVFTFRDSVGRTKDFAITVLECIEG